MMRKSWVALALLVGQVECFSGLPPTQDARQGRRLESSAQESDYVDTMYPPENLIDIDPPAFEWNQQWLEEATAELMDLNTFPVGTLTPEDVESIAGLMIAWVRRRSVEAALKVEDLLKRVVDDLRAGNQSIQVTTRMYTIAMDAWAKCGATGTAERAQHIHEAMIQMYNTTGDPAIAPSNISYNTLLNAWAKSWNGTAMAEKILEEMIDAWKEGNKDLMPDRITFTTLMDAYARSDDPDAAERAEELFEMMNDFGIPKNVHTFSALQNVYARSQRPDAPELAKRVLDDMFELAEAGDTTVKPNVVHFNSILNALSRTPSRTSAQEANKLLVLMETPVEEGGYGVDPDRLTFALTILACARCPDVAIGADLAEENLIKMEARAEKEEQKRLEVSSVAPPAVTMDVECYNVVLQALAKSRKQDAVERSRAILQRMEESAEKGNQKRARPNIRSWNALLNAYARSTDRDAARNAENVLNDLHVQAQADDSAPKPDAFSWAAVLSAYNKSTDRRAAERADRIVRRMEQLYEEGKIESPPDVYHYTIVCAAWAKCQQKGAQARCVQILSHMMERDKAGFPKVRPNVRTYNAVLDCIAREGDEEKAEQLLYHMLRLYRQGDTEAGPDAFSFNSVIYAFTRSGKRGAGKRAEAILDMLLDYYRDENPYAKPDLRSFTQLINYYARSKEPDAPYRAEYILSRIIALYEGGMKELAPTVMPFCSVIDAYAYGKHPDAGVKAERLLKLMRELKEKHGLVSLEPCKIVMNRVMHAWTLCGDEDAGLRAEVSLDYMERSYAAGKMKLKPDTRSYGLALNAWSRSSTYGKAQRARDILRRMQEQQRKGNDSVIPNEHAYSLVINTCAFSNGGADEQQQAFEIATAVFDEMLESKESMPSSLTYAWFIQACSKLQVEKSKARASIEKAFKLCCKHGLVNDFVMVRFRAAADDDLYKELMSSVFSNTTPEPWPPAKMSQVPREWTRNRRSDRKRIRRNRDQ